MKKKSFLCAAAVALMAVAGIYGYNANKPAKHPSMFDLNSVEAVAACETSSNPFENNGYCFPTADNKGDACITGVPGGAVPCNGNL